MVECPVCHATRITAIYDRERDCTVAYKCSDCGHEWDRPLGEIIAVQEVNDDNHH